ncbi:MAG: hypothetical protein ACYSO3_08610 [Planctomycetota bacterium]|jgi:hypothetical protein
MSETSDQLPVNSEEELEQLKEVNQQQGEEIEQLKTSSNPQASSLTPQVSQKTQGVKPSRSGAASVLQSAAKKAARSNSRSDVHEYMRIRRGYV